MGRKGKGKGGQKQRRRWQKWEGRRPASLGLANCKEEKKYWKEFRRSS